MMGLDDNQDSAPIVAVPLGMALFADGGICQSQIDSPRSEIPPVRIVGLRISGWRPRRHRGAG